MRRLLTLACFLAMFGLVRDLRAGDEEYFEGLIPGEPLAEWELDVYYGRGVPISFEIGSGAILNLENFPVSSEEVLNLVNSADLSLTSGITENVSFIGDNNEVTITVGITVNINTVSIADSSGASITVNQSLSMSGGISALGEP